MNNGRCHFDSGRHIYTIDGKIVPSVTQTLEMGGLTDDYRGVPAHVRAFAATRGSYVHEACALYDAALADPAQHHLLPAWFEALDPQIRGYVEGWRKFREREPFVPEGIEELVWTDGTREEDTEIACAGTIDRYGIWDGYPTVLDIKTGSKVSWNTAHQLAAYSWLKDARVMIKHPKAWMPGLAETRRQVVHLKAEGTYALPPPYTDSRDLDDFLAALAVTHCRLRNGHKLPESLA